jgi:hypothetical protein
MLQMFLSTTTSLVVLQEALVLSVAQEEDLFPPLELAYGPRMELVSDFQSSPFCLSSVG